MKMKKSTSDRVMDAIILTVFLLFAFICIYPFYYLIINTISANDLSARGDIMFWPRGIHFENYNHDKQK